MKRILCIILLLVVNGPAFGAEMTQEDLIQNLKKGLWAINDLHWHFDMSYRLKNEPDEKGYSHKLIQADYWYTRRGSAREESEMFYMPGSPKYLHIFKLEKKVYNVYVVAKDGDGSVQKTSFPASQWDASGATPYYFFTQIKARIRMNIPWSIEYQPGPNMYVLTFDSPDQAIFEINGKTWIPYSQTLSDEEKGTILKTSWDLIRINEGVSDEMFRVPEPQQQSAAGQAVSPTH